MSLSLQRQTPAPDRTDSVLYCADVDICWDDSVLFLVEES